MKVRGLATGSVTTASGHMNLPQSPNESTVDIGIHIDIEIPEGGVETPDDIRIEMSAFGTLMEYQVIVPDGQVRSEGEAKVTVEGNDEVVNPSRNQSG